MKKYKFRAKIAEASVGTGGAFVLFPYDVEKEFGIIRIGMESPFGSKAAFPNPPHLNE